MQQYRRSGAEMDNLIAGAMTLPVIGNIVAIALSMVCP
jgi:hypothetical protein